MKTKIIKTKGDWQEVVNDCRSSVSKPPLEKEPSSKFKHDILISEHSPIRNIWIKWQWPGIPYWIGMHFKTHIWPSVVSTQRSDRTGEPRQKKPQDAPVDFTGEANCQHHIDTSRKRLCYMASPETREHQEDLKLAIHAIELELADVMVPNCIYRCGCPELNGGCGWFSQICKSHPDFASPDIHKRYAAYNEWFYEGKEAQDDFCSYGERRRQCD